MSEPPTSKFIDPRLLDQLLASNNVPDPDAIAGLKEYAASLEDASSVLLGELRNAQDPAEQLIRQNAAIDEKLQAVKTVLHPVRAVPADVLLAICSHLVPAPSEIISFGDSDPDSLSYSEFSASVQNSLNPRNSIWSVSQVCQNWRYTIIESPSLWSTISVQLPNPDANLADAERRLYGALFLLQLYLRRAKNYPLVLICWSTAYSMNPYHPLLAVLSAHLEHVRVLVTKLPIAATQTFLQTGSIANVEQLVAQVNTDQRTFDFSLCRKLWSIRINFLGIPGNSGQNIIYILPDTVTHYRGLLVTEASDLQSLGSLPHLQDLSLIASNWEEMLAINIRLPALTRMYMELTMEGPRAVGPIFHIINAPQLETLTIFVANDAFFRDIPSSGSIPIIPALSTVKILHVMFEHKARTDGISFLNSFPNVEHLMIAAPNLDAQVISGLRLHTYDVPLLPRLQSLKLVEYSAQADIGSSVIAVAESRRREGNGSVLRKVSLAHELNVDEPSRETWEVLQRDGLDVEYGAVNDVEKVYFG